MYGMAQPIAFERIVRPSTVFELAVMNGLSLRGKGTQHHLTAALRHLPPANIDQFLRKFIDVNTVLCGNLDAIERVSFEFLEDAQKDKLTNLEVELWPFTLLQQDDYSIFVDDVVSVVLKGFERGYKIFGVKARLNLLTTVDPPVSSVAPFDVSVMDGAYLQSEDMAHNTEERSLATVGSSSESFVVLDQTYKSFPEDKLMLSITSDEVQTASYHAFSVMQANCAIINSLVSELFPMQDNMEENVTQTTLDHDCVLGSPEALTPSDRESLLKAANTSLNSKVVSQNSAELSPIAVDAVLKVMDPNRENNVNLKDIKIIKKLGGTVEDTELVDGLVFTEKAANVNGPKKVEKAKIGLIQFCVSPPKTDMDNQVVVSDYAAMDRVLREERAYILNIVKQIKKAGCNVLLIQKSILRDALSDLAVHFFDKMKIMVVKDIEREDIDHVCKTLGCRPIASLDHFTAENLVSADLVQEVQTGSSKFVKVTGINHPGKTVSIIIRGSNKLMLEEADRSIHDALCVIRCLVKKRFIIAGGGAPETEVARELMLHANSLVGADAYCFKAFAEAMEVIPYTLAENAGLNPIGTVTELRNRHAQGEKTAGINVRKGAITNILEENVVQPLLVSTSAVTLASETVRSILKIDDIVNTIRQ